MACLRTEMSESFRLRFKGERMSQTVCNYDRIAAVSSTTVIYGCAIKKKPHMLHNYVSIAYDSMIYSYTFPIKYLRYSLDSNHFYAHNQSPRQLRHEIRTQKGRSRKFATRQQRTTDSAVPQNGERRATSEPTDRQRGLFVNN